MVHVKQVVSTCVCLCFQPITVELHGLWPRCLACLSILTLSSLHVKVSIICQVYRHSRKVSKVVGEMLSAGNLTELVYYLQPDNYQPCSRGDNTFGSVCVSVRLSVGTLLFELFDLWPWFLARGSNLTLASLGLWVKVKLWKLFEQVVRSRSILGLSLPSLADGNCKWSLAVHWNYLFVSNQGALTVSRVSGRSALILFWTKRCLMAVSPVNTSLLKNDVIFVWICLMFSHVYVRGRWCLQHSEIVQAAYQTLLDNIAAASSTAAASDKQPPPSLMSPL